MGFSTTNNQFSRTFGAMSSMSNGANGASEDRPKANLWLNIGYVAHCVLAGESEPRFISPFGIPLDTAKEAERRGQNSTFLAMIDASNELLRDVQDAAKQLEPGQTAYFNIDAESGLITEIVPVPGQLVLQLRRVRDEAPATEADSNPFARSRPKPEPEVAAKKKETATA